MSFYHEGAPAALGRVAAPPPPPAPSDLAGLSALELYNQGSGASNAAGTLASTLKPPTLPPEAINSKTHTPSLKPSLRSSPVTPPRFRPLGQPETRFADEKVVTHKKRKNAARFGWYGRVVLIDQSRSSANWPLAKALQR